MEDIIKSRLELCEKSIQETFDQIKFLQNRHQQLIGYKQGLSDLLNDFISAEEESSLKKSVESVAPKKKQSAA